MNKIVNEVVKIEDGPDGNVSIETTPDHVRLAIDLGGPRRDYLAAYLCPSEARKIGGALLASVERAPISKTRTEGPPR